MIAKSKILKDLNYLNKNHINLLNYDLTKPNDNKKNNIYAELFDGIIVERIFKPLNINPQDNPSIFDFFIKDKNIWQASFYDPEIVLTINDILNHKISAFEKVYQEVN